jgi:hypothetical protein
MLLPRQRWTSSDVESNSKPPACRPTTAWTAWSGSVERRECRRGSTPRGCGICGAGSIPSPAPASPRLDVTREELFAEETPDGCPTDPIEKQKFLNAHALIRLLDGAAGSNKSGRAEFVVVIDADAPHPTGPVAEFSIPVEIPPRVLATLAGTADIHAVVVCNGVVLHAPGELNLGRSSRLANRAQRRALRGLYRTCGIPGCAVHYDRCKLHHVIWWRNGGRTDLDNLLPVCSQHHANIHNDGWTIELGPNRELTLSLPDGTTHTTGPPTRQAAA